MLSIKSYFRASSIEEILTYVEENFPTSRLMAGGTDLLLKIQENVNEPVSIIDISNVESLIGIDVQPDGLRIGAATKLADFIYSSLLIGGLEILACAASEVGSPQIQNLATVGGNICSASPSADMAAPLMALDAKAEIVSIRGSRILPIESFFTEPGKTALTSHEILKAFLIPWPTTDSKSLYIKHKTREAMEIAMVGISMILWKENNRYQSRIALSAVAPTPVRARIAERIIHEAPEIDDQVVLAASYAASQCINPISDIRASAEYRREMVRLLTERVIRQLCEIGEEEREKH